MPANIGLFAAAPDREATLAGHGWHIVEALAILATTLLAIWVAEYVQRRRKQPSTRPAKSRPGVLWVLAALAGAGAAAVHFIVMPEHFEESALYGTFFLVSATAQLVYSAVLLLRPSRPLIAIGALGNLAIVLLWLVTRTIGIPLGPGAGTTESVGTLDVIATSCEVVTVAAAVALLGGRAVRSRRDRDRLARQFSRCITSRV